MSTINLSDQVAQMLKQHHFGVLATYGGDYPYTSLISIAFTDNVSSLIFPTLRKTHKFTNLLYESRVSVMLENRSFEQDPQKLYALTLLGTSAEVSGEKRSEYEQLFIKNHSHLAGFLQQADTALIAVTLTKVVLVEEFQKVQEFTIST